MSQIDFHQMYLADEKQCIEDLMKMPRLSNDNQASIFQKTQDIIIECRSAAGHGSIFDALLQEYGLSSDEGVALMRLVEALIRTSDSETAQYLIRDKFTDKNWKSHQGNSSAFLVNRASNGLSFSHSWIAATGGTQANNLLAKLGDKVLHQALKTGMKFMSEHFVLGSNIDEAQKNAGKYARKGYVFSYDMLGEAAYTWEDAEKYRQAYLRALKRLSAEASPDKNVHENSGLSVKLSAIHPRYEYIQKDDCVPFLVKTLIEMALIAKEAKFGLTIDAEEVDKLELSMKIATQLLEAPELDGWDGLSIVVQAYQRRAVTTITHLLETARKNKRPFCIRLVKGAYWDSEIKRAQELGLSSYPVFTRKENTDVSYLACAQLLLDSRDIVYPQFATHNAATMMAVLAMAGDDQRLEFQRLHGMGEVLHDAVMEKTDITSRIYAPVGRHKELLPYLVRRLLENGANSSFVNQFLNPDIPPSSLAQDPIKTVLENPSVEHDQIPAPRDLFSGMRQSAFGIDHTQAATANRLESLIKKYKTVNAHPIISGKSQKGKKREIANPSKISDIVGTSVSASTDMVERAIKSAAKSKWGSFSQSHRAECLRKAAQGLEDNSDLLLTLCVKEAGKTWNDAIAELREAIDFCEYYADQAETTDIASRKRLGVVACISPWNFPLAIFLGQITGSLAVGNSVICKPAEQTPLIAFETVKILHASGIPTDALHFLPGSGSIIGTAMTSSPGVNGVCFTGSTATAKRIAKTLADTNRGLVPIIAETGGLNAMIIDSTALLEQAVSDVIASGFQSAGQRCSACRLVCVQDDIAPAFKEMLSGAMQTLKLGDPAFIKTDLGPVIDTTAQSQLEGYIESNRLAGKTLWQTRSDNLPEGHFLAPTAIEIESISHMEEEQFGPIVHIYTFKASGFDALIGDINALGYGLTMGLHTRIDSRAEHVSKIANVGNIYVNRNQIGAVVGVQPFGGEGLSGTGPKAGGPNYLKRLSRQAKTSPMASKNRALDFEMQAQSSDLVSKTANEAKQAAVQLEKLFKTKGVHTLFTTPNQIEYAEIAKQFSETEHLPGPTGETNQLKHFPRGVLLCEADNDLGKLTKQILRALATGNIPIVIAESELHDQLKSIEDGLTKLKGLGQLIFCLTPDNLAGALSSDIAGFVSDGSARNAIAKTIITQPGAIKPILSVHDDIYRFGVERTLTIDVSAAGGNATLLAL